MVQCEMCGADTASPKTIKVEGAELSVCANCTEFGTEVRTQESASTTATKYSTSSSSGGSSGSSGSSGGGSSGRRRRTDMFDQMDELAADYDDRIRSAREGAGLSQEELAKQLNEKASLIRKLERGDVLPSDEVQKKLERKLSISLTGEAGADGDEEWEGGGGSGGLTLGDMVKRKD